MDPYRNDPTASQLYHVPTTAHSATTQRRSGSPPREQRSYMPYSGQFSSRGAPYPFYSGMPAAYPPQHKGADPRIGTQYQSSSSTRPPDLMSVPRSVEVTRAGPAQALSSIVPSPTSQIITSHRVVDHAEALSADAGPSRRFSNVRMSSKPRSTSSRGSPRATPSLIKAEAPTTLGASMSGGDCFSTAEEPVPYALTDHPVFSEDLKKACTPIRKVENPFAAQKKTPGAQEVYGEYSIHRYRNDVSSGHFVEGHQQQNAGAKVAAGIEGGYPNGVKESMGSRNEYAIAGSSSIAHDRGGGGGGGALDLSLKSFRNSSEPDHPIYLGKEATREVAKQTMPYDYSYTQPSAKRSADECDPNAGRSKYLKMNSTPNNVPLRQPPQSASHGAFVGTKGVAQSDPRAAYDASSFAQAHTSLTTLAYGRQIQSANSSGYFSEGISESGAPSPVSPRAKLPSRGREKDRTEQKFVGVEAYYPHGRVSSKNSPYNAYSGQYSSVYDRGRLDESAIKYNSNSAADGYYQGFSVDRYRTGESVGDNCMPFRSSTSTYGKIAEVSSQTARQNYENYVKNVTPDQQFGDQKSVYPRLLKTEVNPRRQPKIEIASQPINLIEDNEISIEKTQNNTLPFEAFGRSNDIKMESNSFQSELEAKALKASRLAARADAIRSHSVTPTNKVVSGEIRDVGDQMVVSKAGKTIEIANNLTPTSNVAFVNSTKPMIGDCARDMHLERLDNFNDSKEERVMSHVQYYNHTQNLSECGTVKQKPDGHKTNTESNAISADNRTTALSSVVVDDFKNGHQIVSSQESDEFKTDNIVSRSSANDATETTKENIHNLKFSKDTTEIGANIKQEKEDIKCERDTSPARNDFLNAKPAQMPRISKVNYADVNSLKEQSLHRNLPHILTRNHQSGGNIVMPKSNSVNNPKIAPPILNLSVPTNQAGFTARKFLDEIPPRPNSQTRGHSTPLDRNYQNLPFNSSYYDIKAQSNSLQHNNTYTQRSHSSLSASHYSQMSSTDKTKYPYSPFYSDATSYDTKQAIVSEHKNLNLPPSASKPESYGALTKHTSALDAYPRTKNSYGANMPAALDSTPKAYQRDTKEAYLSHSTSETVPLKSVPSKQVPLAINPRVLSPWNSAMPHSVAIANRKPSTVGCSQLQNTLLRESSPQDKEPTDNEKKLRMATYSHPSYGHQYAYMPPDNSHSSAYGLNAVSDRPQSSSYDTKTSSYPPPRSYSSESPIYKAYPATAPLGNAASQSITSGTTLASNRSLLTPHSPPHPPPPRVDTAHHQPLYYSQPYSASISPRTIGDHYSRTSPQFAAAVDPKYPSREYSPYPYKCTYPPQSTAERTAYPNPSAYYSHSSYNVGSSTRPSQQAKYEFAHQQSYGVPASQEPSYVPERSIYAHAPAYNYAPGSTAKEYSTDKTPLPPAAHLQHASSEYKATYDNLHAMQSSSQNNPPYSNQYLEQKGYIHTAKTNQANTNPAIPSSYPHCSAPKSSYQGFAENQADKVNTVHPEYEVGQYTHSYPHSTERGSIAAINRHPYNPARHSESVAKTTIPKAQSSVSVAEYEVKSEDLKEPAINTQSLVPSQIAAHKDNNGKIISNPVQPLYSSWPNYKASHLDTLNNKQLVKPRSLETLQNISSQRYPSFKTDREAASQPTKMNASAASFLGKILQSSNNPVKSTSAKEQVPFTRPESHSKPLLPNRFNNQSDLKLSDLSKEMKPSVTLPETSNSLDMDFDQLMGLFEADLKTNGETIISKKSQILAKRYAQRIDLQHLADAAGILEEEEPSFEETDSEPEPPCKFRGKIKRIKDKKVERLILTYASHSDDSATEMIADEDESDFEEELVKEIRAKARKGRAKDKISKEATDDSDDRHTRSSKLKKESGLRDTSSNNSSDTSSDSSEESNSSDSCLSVARVKSKPCEASSSDCEARLTRNTRSKKRRDSKRSCTPVRENMAKRGKTLKRKGKSVKNISDLSDDEVKPKRVRSIVKGYSSNSDDDTLASSTDCDSKIGGEKGRRLLLESDSDDDDYDKNITSEAKESIPEVDPILRKLEEQRKSELMRPDVIEMKAWKQKTGEQAAALLKSLPVLPMRHSWRRPFFAGVFKKGWQTEMRKYKQETVRTPKQLVTIPAMPANLNRKRGRGMSKNCGNRGKDSKDGLYSKAMMRRFFDKVLQLDSKEDESLSRASSFSPSSSPYSTFTPTGLTPTPSVSPSMLVTGVGGRDSDKDSLTSIRGESPPASDSATLRRRSIATTIIQKIQRQQCKNRRLEAPWLTKSRSAIKTRTPTVLPLPRSLSSSDAASSTGKKKKPGDIDLDRIRSVFGEDSLVHWKHSSQRLLGKRKKYFSPLSSSTHSTSSTPSTPVGTDEVGGVVVSRKRKMKKFRSGFDYIPRKKKKLKAFDEVASKTRKKVAARRRRVWPESTRDVATEVKTWVINKGLGETALHRAARLQYHDVVIYCLESKEINVNARDNAGYTPLHEACNRGHLDVAQALCAFGGHVNAPGYGGMRPLHEACDNGHAQLIRLLLSYGADINLASYAGQSCLSLATEPACRTLVLDFANDLRGKKAKPWSFEGPARLFDLEEQGADFFREVAPKAERMDEALSFECSDALLPNTYVIKDYADQYVLLDELLTHLDSTYNDFVTKIKHIETVSLDRKEFDQKAYCLVVNKNRPNSALQNGDVTFVKYTKRLQNLLGVETVAIT